MADTWNNTSNFTQNLMPLGDEVGSYSRLATNDYGRGTNANYIYNAGDGGFGSDVGMGLQPINGTPGQVAGTDDLGFWDKGGTLDTGMGSFGKMAGGMSSLANVYLGFQNLDMAKEKMGIYREQWDMAKQELKHMQGTRKAITNKFAGK